MATATWVKKSFYACPITSAQQSNATTNDQPLLNYFNQVNILNAKRHAILHLVLEEQEEKKRNCTNAWWLPFQKVPVIHERREDCSHLLKKKTFSQVLFTRWRAVRCYRKKRSGHIFVIFFFYLVS